MHKNDIKKLVEGVAQAASKLQSGYVGLTYFFLIENFKGKPQERYWCIAQARREYNLEWIERTTDKVYYDFMYEFYRF